MGWSWQASITATLLLAASPALAAERAGDASARPCPAGLDAVATCSVGRDANGAFYLTAMPRNWNRVLVVHAHGGPRLTAPKADDSDEDLERFAVMVRRGYAWTGSTYRRSGYGVRMAAADVESSRALFWQRFGKPRLTILHGQSYGGNVAAKLAELGATDVEGNRLFDGVLLTNGVLWGGTRAYVFRADLRAVYQYYCRNHPGPDEAPYPLWSGLPRDSRVARNAVELRVNACTGLDRPRGLRTPEQASRLASIVAVTGIAEDQIVRHLEWATFHFQDVVQKRLGGRNPFDNSKTVYRGSADDEALNRGVERFVADPRAVAQLAYDSDLTGLIAVPTLAVHWANDPIASPKGDLFYAGRIAAQGRGDLFLGLAVSEGTHSRLPGPDIAASLDALVAWIDTGTRADAPAIRQACQTLSQSLNDRCSLR